jgi:hypothetical protein
LDLEKIEVQTNHLIKIIPEKMASLRLPPLISTEFK